VKLFTLHVPLLHIAVCDVHTVGHCVDDEVYAVTLAPCHVVHHRGKSQSFLHVFPSCVYHGLQFHAHGSGELHDPLLHVIVTFTIVGVALAGVEPVLQDTCFILLIQLTLSSVWNQLIHSYPHSDPLYVLAGSDDQLPPFHVLVYVLFIACALFGTSDVHATHVCVLLIHVSLSSV
jgi:hypothetical protein